MKIYITTLLVSILHLSSISQTFWKGYYGEKFSFGVELNQNTANVDFISLSSHQSDTSVRYGYTSLLPHLKLHLNIGSFTSEDVVYFNITYGLNLNIHHSMNGERAIGNFPVSHFLETGLTYLKGEEYGNAYVGSLSLAFLPSFNLGELFLGPNISAGYQFEYDHRLIQIYAKAGLGLLGNLEKENLIDFQINGNNFESKYTYNSHLIGIGVVYRGFN